MGVGGKSSHAFVLFIRDEKWGSHYSGIAIIEYWEWKVNLVYKLLDLGRSAR